MYDSGTSGNFINTFLIFSHTHTKYMQGKTDGDRFFRNPSLNRRCLKKSASVHNSHKQKNTPAQQPPKPGETICRCLNLPHWSQKCVCFEECSQASEHGSPWFPSCPSQHLSILSSEQTLLHIFTTDHHLLLQRS